MSLAGPIRRPDARAVGGIAPLRRLAGTLALWLWTLAAWPRLRPGQRRPAWARPQRLLLGGVVAIALIGVSIAYLDALAIGARGSLAPWIVLRFETMTEFGRSAWVLIPSAAALLVLASASPAIGRLQHLVLTALAVRIGFLFVAVAVPGLVVTIVKRLIGRARPYMEAGPFEFVPFGWSAAYASLPSGHGTTSFAAAFALASLFPRWRVSLWCLAGLIAASRVIVGAHFPSDVIAGAVIGTLGALAVRNLFALQRLGFVVAPDRSVRALPGPSRLRVTAALRALVRR